MPIFQSGGGQVGSAQITDNSIVNADVNSAAAIALSKLAPAAETGNFDSIIAPHLLQYTTVDFSSAEIKAITSANPKLLVAAPGAGKRLIPVQVMFEYTYGTAGYTGGHDWLVTYNTVTTNLFNTTIGASFIAPATANAVALMGDSKIGDNSAPANEALYLRGSTTNLFATGDGTIKIHIWYRKVTL